MKENDVVSLAVEVKTQRFYHLPYLQVVLNYAKQSLLVMQSGQTTKYRHLPQMPRLHIKPNM